MPSVTVRSLKRDVRGAVLVMGLPMALFLVGALHYATGIGDAILHRETLQDAADASAFSAAVMMARGMNLIVLINVVMASLLALVVALKITDVMLLVGIALCSLLSYPTYGATLAAVPGLKSAQFGVSEASEVVEPMVEQMLVALHGAAQVMRYAIPIAAEARVVDTSRHYAPPAIVGFAIPNQFALPTEDGTEEQLCGKAGEYAARFATLPVRWALPEAVLGLLEGGLGAATQSLATYFCSSSSTGAPPAVPVPETRVRQQFPKLPKTRECEDLADAAQTVRPEHQKVCQDAQIEVQRSEPNPATGACAQADCTAYETRVELARSECVPTVRARIEEWMWQERDVTLRAEPIRRDPYPLYVEHQEVERGPFRMRSGSHPPCGDNGTVATDWQPDVTLPLCIEPHEELTPEGPVFDRDPQLRLEVVYREVTQVIGCSKSVSLVSPTASARPTARPRNNPSPSTTSSSTACQQSNRVHQNVQADAELGSETFQLRAIVIGESPSEKHREVLDKVVLRKRDTESPWSGVDVGDALQQVSHLFVAQAEYYFDADLGSDRGRDRLEWMWTMDWRARLVRFRLPSDDSDPSQNQSQDQASACGTSQAPAVDVTDACTAAGGGDACGSVGTSLDGLADLFIH